MTTPVSYSTTKDTVHDDQMHAAQYNQDRHINVQLHRDYRNTNIHQHNKSERIYEGHDVV